MNEIMQENAIVQGRADASYWDVPHSTEIEGFATDMSVNAGTRVDFKINVNGGAGSDYMVEIFRLGYYGGSGAREVAQWTNTNAKVQPNALVNAATGTVDAGNWSVTDGWNVPADAVSGVYLARLQRLDSNGDPIDGAVNQIPFVVRNDGETHDIVLQTSDTTWQAYNAWGGNNGVVGANLYGDMNDSINWDPIPGAGANSQDRAYAVSYNRPFITRDGTGAVAGAQDYVFGADYAAIYWLEKQGYDVAYISGVDTDRLGPDYLKNYKSFISVGHDEYWSGDQRANVEEARDSGVNLLFWSGNEVYWKIRWDVAYSADGTPYRTLVCYKETLAVGDANAGPQDYYNLDPTDIWTGTWMDTRFHGNPLAGGGNPQDVDPITGLNPACHCGQNQLTGQLFGPDGTGQFGGALDVPANYATLRVWRDTTIANGGKLDIAPGILGYEWDTSPDDNLRPAGLIKLSETTLPWNAILVDQGNTTLPGEATHNLSLYRTASGSLVFGAGTTFWTWALSNRHDGSPYDANIENIDIQQFTINMFADMGIQPGVADAILISQGLKRASASTDTTPAVASINDLPDSVEALKPVTITGAATDNDGNPLTTDGRVAAVEVSVDGGATWKVASTTNNWATWSFYWYPTKQGAVTIEARAIDDSLNVYNITPDSEAVTVTAPTTFSAFSGATPGSPVLNNESTAIELGMRFAVDRAGSVTELKYWRGSGDANDTDLREGHLWRAEGTLLATVIFTSTVGQAGWQIATLSTPVTLTAGTQYIVSYRTDNNYVATGNYFVDANDVGFDGLDNNSFWGFGGVVRVVQDGVDGNNGVYGYGSGPAVMPSQSFNGANYWVDITFDALSPPVNSPPVITSAATLTSPENRLVAGTITATDANANPLTYAIVGGADTARFTINASSGVLSFVSAPDFEAPADADANNVYNLTVSVSDGIAPAVTQAITVTVADRAENGGTGSNVFDSIGAPATTETADQTDYELGMSFTANVAGSITELRYFRGTADANDTDTRVLNLWNAAGVLLGSVTVTSTVGESGWQIGTLSAPISIQAGATYIVSYGTTQNYAVTSNYFTTAHSGPDGVLTAGVSSGVFANGTPGAFPTASYNAANYWADVTFIPTPVVNVAPIITSAAALTSPENRLTVGTITATDANANPLTYAIAGGADAALFTIDAQTGLLRFVSAPNYEAPADAGGNNVYDLTVSVTDGIAPAVTQAITVSVTDRAENGGESNVFDVDDAPATTETADQTDYELGMSFTANTAGAITQLRYFRGAADANDTDTRVLNLWNAAGNLLGSVTVSSAPGESGWQVGTLSTPIAIQAGATYIVSYGTTQNYVVTSNYFTTAHSGPDGVLTAGVSSGVFANGAPGAFPTASYNASNYWADVTFVPNSAPIITSGADFSVPENRSLAATITATDANASPLSYAIVGGADAALFTIDAQTGLLRFVTNPNYEAPADAGANNVYDLTVSVTDGIAPPVTQAITVSVTDRAENGTGSNVFGLTDAPTTTETTDQTDYELGMRFTANTAGAITQLRYFRGAADANDTDTRVLNLWNAAGILLGSVTVSSAVGESGWQIGTLSAPIAIEAGATYVVSYGTTQNYAITANYFTTAHAGPDGVLAASAAGGVFANGTPGIFPAASYNDSNYWVDVTFTDGTTPSNSAPVFTSPAAATAVENQLVAMTLSANDANGGPLTYAIAGGTDASRFIIDASTGVLSFVSAPDFETPADAGANNIYDVTVSVSDGNAAAVTQALAISVSDTNEAPTIAPIAAPSTNEDVTTPVQINLLSGAADPEGNTITVLSPVTVTSSNAARTVAFTVSAAGVLSFDPAQFGALNAGQSELLTVTYQIGDGVNPGVPNSATVTVEGRDENQIITGTAANNTLTGGEGNDTINGLAGNDTIRGNGGSDTINGGANTDNIDAGAGNDLILIIGSDAISDTMAGGLGTDTVKITGTADAVLTGTSQMTGIEIFDGSNLSLRGTASGNTFDFSAYTLTNLAGILALDGNDTVRGSAGADVIDGGNGTDNIDGGLGNDTIRVTSTEAQADTIDGGGGIDILQIFGTVDLTLNGTSTITGVETLDGGGRSIVGTTGANVIDLSIFTTVTNLTGVRGLSGNDTLTGSSFADRLDGGSGDDTIRGGAGDDTIVARTSEALNDVIDGGAGTADRILIDGNSSLSLSNTNLITGIERLEGGGGAIVGSSGADTLDFSGISVSGVSSIQGGFGADTIAGGTGADVLIGGSGNDAFVYRIGVAAGADRITDFDVAGNDVIRLVGFSPSSNLAAATTFDAEGALIDLSDVGGSGTIRLAGVTSLSFTTEDFIFS